MDMVLSDSSMTNDVSSSSVSLGIFGMLHHSTAVRTLSKTKSV